MAGNLLAPPPALEGGTADSMRPVDLWRSEEFHVYCFKILSCPKKESHDWSTCPWAHPKEQARRRDPRRFYYSPVLCPNAKAGAFACPLGDSCTMAHHIYEMWLHPLRFRSELCRKGPTCDRTICFFAHKPDELRFPAEEELIAKGAMAPRPAATLGTGGANGSGSPSSPSFLPQVFAPGGAHGPRAGGLVAPHTQLAPARSWGDADAALLMAAGGNGGLGTVHGCGDSGGALFGLPVLHAAHELLDASPGPPLMLLQPLEPLPGYPEVQRAAPQPRMQHAMQFDAAAATSAALSAPFIPLAPSYSSPQAGNLAAAAPQPTAPPSPLQPLQQQYRAVQERLAALQLRQQQLTQLASGQLHANGAFSAPLPMLRQHPGAAAVAPPPGSGPGLAIHTGAPAAAARALPAALPTQPQVVVRAATPLSDTSSSGGSGGALTAAPAAPCGGSASAPLPAVSVAGLLGLPDANAISGSVVSLVSGGGSPASSPRDSCGSAPPGGPPADTNGDAQLAAELAQLTEAAAAAAAAYGEGAGGGGAAGQPLPQSRVHVVRALASALDSELRALASGRAAAREAPTDAGAAAAPVQPGRA